MKENKRLPSRMPHVVFACYRAIGDIPRCSIAPRMFQHLHIFKEDWNEIEPFLVGKETAGVVIYAVTQHPSAPKSYHIARGFALLEADEPQIEDTMGEAGDFVKV